MNGASVGEVSRVTRSQDARLDIDTGQKTVDSTPGSVEVQDATRADTTKEPRSHFAGASPRLVMRALLSDPERLLRDALKQFLRQKADIDVVGETSDGLETVKLTEALAPDLLILDVALSTWNGVEVIERLRAEPSGLRIIVLTARCGAVHVAQGLQAGADAYVSKRAPAGELLAAIECVGQGGWYLSQDLSVRFGSAEEASRMASGDPFDELTSRERQVFALIARGLETRQVARRLGISPKTVDVHRLSIGSKLALKTPLDFHRFAQEHGPI